jgi:hypothetical protein
MYEVQHYTLADGWVNTWTHMSDGEDDGKPVTFATEAQAQKALEEFWEDEAAHAAQASADGEEFFPYDPDEFRIWRVDLKKVSPEGARQTGGK